MWKTLADLCSIAYALLKVSGNGTNELSYSVILLTSVCICTWHHSTSNLLIHDTKINFSTDPLLNVATSEMIYIAIRFRYLVHARDLLAHFRKFSGDLLLSDSNRIPLAIGHQEGCGSRHLRVGNCFLACVFAEAALTANLETASRFTL